MDIMDIDDLTTVLTYVVIAVALLVYAVTSLKGLNSEQTTYEQRDHALHECSRYEIQMELCPCYYPEAFPRELVEHTACPAGMDDAIR